MLIRRHRFHGYSSLKTVYARGQSVRGNQLSLKYHHRDPSRPYRVAVVVSRKVNKSAVVRNRIRRRIYEVVSHHANAVPAGMDLVFTAYSDQLADLPAVELERTITKLLNNIS